MGIHLIIPAAKAACTLVTAACTNTTSFPANNTFPIISSKPPVYLQPQFKKSSVWQVLWTRPNARSMVLQAIMFIKPAHPTVCLVLEKEGTILLRIDITPWDVAAIGPLGRWSGPLKNAPASLQIWIAFALHEENISRGKFKLRELPIGGRLILTAPNGEESLKATRQFSKP